VESTTGGAGTWSLKPTAQMSLSAITAVAKSCPSICGLETAWRPALAVATTLAANNIANTRVRIVLNLGLSDREQLMLAAIMPVLQMVNNLAAA
jgi:hypothetical protein